MIWFFFLLPTNYVPLITRYTLLYGAIKFVWNFTFIFWERQTVFLNGKKWGPSETQIMMEERCFFRKLLEQGKMVSFRSGQNFILDATAWIQFRLDSDRIIRCYSKIGRKICHVKLMINFQSPSQTKWWAWEYYRYKNFQIFQMIQKTKYCNKYWRKPCVRNL